MIDRIRNLREDKDLSQREIAKELSIAQTTYSGYELGNRNIPNSILIKLAEFHETSIDYLLELTDEPAPYPRRRPRL